MTGDARPDPPGIRDWTLTDVLSIVQNRDRKVTRRDVSVAYGELLRVCMRARAWPDIATVNNAILARWSISGLEWIKREAWKYAESGAGLDAPPRAPEE